MVFLKYLLSTFSCTSIRTLLAIQYTPSDAGRVKPIQRDMMGIIHIIMRLERAVGSLGSAAEGLPAMETLDCQKLSAPETMGMSSTPITAQPPVPI